MTQSWPESANPFELRPSEKTDARCEPVRTRRLSLPLVMDDGQVRSFDLPSALGQPSQLSAGELERLTRSYAEALGLLAPERAQSEIRNLKSKI